MNKLIAPEIVNDAFALALENTVANFPVKSILELGASSGEGSTACFMRGMHINKLANLYSLEASKERFAALQKRYGDRARITCINAFSVPTEQWLSHAQIEQFIPEFGNEFNALTYKSWLQTELDYQTLSDVPCNGIEQAMALNGGPFDFVLIDSSLFSGVAEMKAIYGAQFIALDDVRSMKTGPSLKQLSTDPHYRLFARGHARYGWAIFQKIA